MAYELEGVITKEKTYLKAHAKDDTVIAVPLGRGFCLVPCEKRNTRLIEDFVTKNSLRHQSVLDFRDGWRPDHLTDYVIDYCVHLSNWGPVMYADAEIFAEMESQMAIVWNRREVILPPYWTTLGQPNQPLNVGSTSQMAINVGLRGLGVIPMLGDGFSVLGLGAEPRTSDWIPDEDGDRPVGPSDHRG